MNQQQENKIISHGEKIIKLFCMDKKTDSLKLCKRLRRFENKAYELSLKSCNEGLNKDDEEKAKEILSDLDKLINFKKQNIKVFINYDARGYALKIDDKHRGILREIGFICDWGGFGIIAPEIK
jgi:hypothetical protein